MARRNDFFYTEAKDLHFERPIEIIKEHPELKQYIGTKNPWSILIVLGGVASQVLLAWVFRNQSWWIVIAASWLVGAFITHALFTMVHELSHNLFFKRKQANTLTGILANSVMFFPSSVSFARYHLKHHAFQGYPEFDADLPSEWEAKLFKNYTIGKMLWFLFYPVIQAARVPRMREIKAFDGWVALNWLVCAGADFAFWYFLGPKAFVYIGASFFFSIGFHPLGGRWVQEHYLTSGNVQETHSYYGPLSIIAFNVGYHNEHHDFPSIPWNKLPEVRKAGAKWYNAIAYHTSWTKLWLRFIFDPSVGIYSRMLRKRHGAK